MVKKILSINHSDALAKTGVQVDLREFQKLDCFGFSAISALLNSFTFSGFDYTKILIRFNFV